MTSVQIAMPAGLTPDRLGNRPFEALLYFSGSRATSSESTAAASVQREELVSRSVLTRWHFRAYAPGA